MSALYLILFTKSQVVAHVEYGIFKFTTFSPKNDGKMTKKMIKIITTETSNKKWQLGFLKHSTIKILGKY